jgi:hypothetical protein
MPNLPKHGDNIVDRRKDALGREKLVASFQFQQFLDDLSSAESGSSSQTINQSVVSSALARIAKLETFSPLTSDETGFSVDSTLLSVDMTEA